MASILRSLHRPPRIANVLAVDLHRSTRPSFRLVVALTSAGRPHSRLLQTSSATRSAPSASTTAVPPKTESPTAPATAGTNADQEKLYYGPLAQTFRRLKIFSVGSLALTCIMTPFLFIIETASAVPLLGRLALAGTVLATSSISTALVAWSGKPYVHILRWLSPENGDTGKQAAGVEFATFTLGLHERTTRVYDTAFLVPTTRPFAKWELAETFKLPPQELEAERANGAFPREETVAETFDGYGNVLGRWVVRWEEDGSGKCYQQGKVLRYFNVHEELLDRPIR